MEQHRDSDRRRLAEGPLRPSVSYLERLREMANLELSSVRPGSDEWNRKMLEVSRLQAMIDLGRR